jgi:DNA-binding NarL/FixJ family response regulator
MKKRIRVLLADDHKIVLDGLRSLLEPEFELAGTVEDGRALVSAAEKLRPDVIVVDISMPLLNGIEAVRQIKKLDKQVKVVFLTMHPDVTYAIRAFEAGASGYVLKHSASSELITAIHEAIKGRTYVTPMIAGELVQAYKGGTYQQAEEAQHLGGVTVAHRDDLTQAAEAHFRRRQELQLPLGVVAVGARHVLLQRRVLAWRVIALVRSHPRPVEVWRNGHSTNGYR